MSCTPCRKEALSSAHGNLPVAPDGRWYPSRTPMEPPFWHWTSHAPSGRAHRIFASGTSSSPAHRHYRLTLHFIPATPLSDRSGQHHPPHTGHHTTALTSPLSACCRPFAFRPLLSLTRPFTAPSASFSSFTLSLSVGAAAPVPGRQAVRHAFIRLIRLSGRPCTAINIAIVVTHLYFFLHRHFHRHRPGVVTTTHHYHCNRQLQQQQQYNNWLTTTGSINNNILLPILQGPTTTPWTFIVFHLHRHQPVIVAHHFRPCSSTVTFIRPPTIHFPHSTSLAL